jgi:hypothetical protein
MGCRSIFTAEEDDVLRRYYATEGGAGCACRIDKTIQQIWNRAYILGVAPRLDARARKGRFDDRALAAALGVPAQPPGIPFPSTVLVHPCGGRNGQ